MWLAWNWGTELQPDRTAERQCPSAIIAVYQLPGSNAIDTMNSAKQLMDELKTRFPEDLDYTVSLDTTLAVSRRHQRDRPLRSSRR